MSDNARDWAQEARERWPGCEAVVTPDGSLVVALGGRRRLALRYGSAFMCERKGRKVSPIDAMMCDLEAERGWAVMRLARAVGEQDEARATLERLRAWGVT